MERVDLGQKRTVYIDVCHNESGIKAVLREVKQTHPGTPIRVACAFSKMKEIEKMIAMLLREVQHINFLACPHFKLESIANLYNSSQQVAQQVARDFEHNSTSLGQLEPLVAGGDLIATLRQVTQASAQDIQAEADTAEDQSEVQLPFIYPGQGQSAGRP